jgi:hypothetical protein
MYQHHIMGKHYDMNSCHVVILVEGNGVLKSSSLIQVFSATTTNQGQKLTFTRKPNYTQQNKKWHTIVLYILNYCILESRQVYNTVNS